MVFSSLLKEGAGGGLFELFPVVHFLSQVFYDQSDQRIRSGICEESPKDVNRKMKIKTGKHDWAS